MVIRWLLWLGNTSACAEKRVARPAGVDRAWKYLRVRGEEPHGLRHVAAGLEIPPRARRRAKIAVPAGTLLEIPPRARRRAVTGVDSAAGNGNTSACAEKRVISIGVPIA